MRKLELPYISLILIYLPSPQLRGMERAQPISFRRSSVVARHAELSHLAPDSSLELSVNVFRVDCLKLAIYEGFSKFMNVFRAWGMRGFAHGLPGQIVFFRGWFELACVDIKSTHSRRPACAATTCRFAEADHILCTKSP